MSEPSGAIGPAFALGFALGAAPGPVQLLILSQTATRGLPGGVRVMLGANLTFFALLLALALGLSAASPGETVLRVLRLAGGLVLIWVAITEFRELRRPPREEVDRATSRWQAFGPTRMGILMVVLNPGAWVFLATTASSVLAEAADAGGRTAAVLAATAMTAGVSLADASFTLLGSGGRRLFGDRGLRWVRTALVVTLAAVGVLFVAQGVLG